MGFIPSVSLPSGVTCRHDCECSKKCYAKKLERLRPNVRASYASNYSALRESPEVYWREVEASIMMSRFFRYHVSGDIPDSSYFEHMITIASRQKFCDMLCFTKKYNIINEFLDSGGVIPNNLHIVFSVWRGLECDNKYNLPEAHVRYRDKTTTAAKGAFECSGNCSECASTRKGCWSLKSGEQVVFNEH